MIETGHIKIPLSSDTFGQMMLQAVRYAIGRQTSAPGDTSAAVKIAWPAIPDRWRGLIMRDVREALAMEDREPGSIGHDCDKRTWMELLDWMNIQSV